MALLDQMSSFSTTNLRNLISFSSSTKRSGTSSTAFRFKNSSTVKRHSAQLQTTLYFTHCSVDFNAHINTRSINLTLAFATRQPVCVFQHAHWAHIVFRCCGRKHHSLTFLRILPLLGFQLGTLAFFGKKQELCQEDNTRIRGQCVAPTLWVNKCSNRFFTARPGY